MSTLHDDEVVTQPTLEILADALDRLREESETSRRETRAEITALKAEIAQLRSTKGVHSTPSSVEHVEESNDKEPTVSRRGALLALGGVAAGGAGLALGSVVMGASPAAAATGDPVIMGQFNTCDGTTAIYTSTGDGLDVTTSSPNRAALNALEEGSDVGGYGVVAQSNNGYGILAAGGLAPLILQGSLTVGPPTSGSHVPGELYVDANGAFYGCAVPGTPGTWVRDSPFVPLGPARAYDSRNNGAGGPLSSGSTRNVSLTSAGFPAGASIVLVNLTITNTVGVGFLTLYAQGASEPNTSNINWSASGQTNFNNATSKVGSTGEIAVTAGGLGSTQFVIDVFGFYY